MSSRDKTGKAVSALVEAMHDVRFSPFLFASALTVESDEINWEFFLVISEYVNLMAQRADRGRLSGEQAKIGDACLKMSAGIDEKIFSFDPLF